MADWRIDSKVLKVDEQGLVLGWGIISTDRGEPYYDLQGDHIPEDSMMEAAADFMEKSRTARDMHRGDGAGTVVFAFPLTSDVAKAFGITTEKTGLIVGIRPSPEMLEKFRSGELTGFSIGGRRVEDEEVAE